ncbi:MAG TPA: NUDIX hydrolase [Azospirillum sp.]|nr:NUDIX hydrolase [Azospirillum sp.]
MRKDLKPWTVASSRDLLDASPFLKVRVETIELPDGRRIEDYYQLDMPSFACIFAETEDGRVIVYRQYRHGPKRLCLAFPGGHVNPGEDPLTAAKRELLEETGYEAAEWQDLGGYTVNANQGGAVSYMFRATGCRKVAAPNSDDLEETEILFLTRVELLQAVGRGEFPLLTQMALLAMVTNADLGEVL